MTGRYAPSPSGELHLGNLRTALLAWLFARSRGERFLMRVEDLDRVAVGAADRQLADLAAIGLDWDEPVLWQSERLAIYRDALSQLTSQGLTYECYCTRAEIAQAATAPHAPPGAYPGTCRELTEAQRARRRQERAVKGGQAPALRLRSSVTEFTVHDELFGSYTGLVDDLVLRRGDGMPAYNLVCVVDDAATGVTTVVRGDDLLPSSPRQADLAGLLGVSAPGYAHVPLALNADGKRLAKRDGAVTLRELTAVGWRPDDVVALLGASAGLPDAPPGDPATTVRWWAERFEPSSIRREPWVVDPTVLAAGPPEP